MSISVPVCIFVCLYRFSFLSFFFFFFFFISDIFFHHPSFRPDSPFRSVSFRISFRASTETRNSVLLSLFIHFIYSFYLCIFVCLLFVIMIYLFICKLSALLLFILIIYLFITICSLYLLMHHHSFASSVCLFVY